MPEKITDALVRTLPVPKIGNRLTRDTIQKGFAIRVTAKGTRSFVLNYHLAGRERRLTIGQYPDWSVTAAREEAKQLKREIDRGSDPLDRRQTDYQAPTTRDLWDRYRRDHLPSLAARHQKDVHAMWDKDILPVLGSKKVSQITSSDVDALHRRISQRAKIRANRIIEVLRKALNLAVRWQWITKNPANGFRRNPEQPRHLYLTQEKLIEIFTCLDRMKNSSAADAIRLLILTGARRSEVLRAEWGQFDLKAGTWVKPALHTKQRQMHQVPLGPEAISLLKEMKVRSASPFLFPSTKRGPIPDINRPWRWLKKEVELPHMRIHDLRHTFASILVSQGETLPVIGALLGHSQSQTTARYAHLFEDPLRAAASKVGAAVTRNRRADDS